MKVALTLLLLLHLKLLRCESESYPEKQIEMRQDNSKSADLIEQKKFFIQTADKLLDVSSGYLIDLEQKIDESKPSEKDYLNAIYQKSLIEYNRLNNLLDLKKKEVPVEGQRRVEQEQLHAFQNQFLVDVLELNNFLEDVISENPH